MGDKLKRIRAMMTAVNATADHNRQPIRLKAPNSETPQSALMWGAIIASRNKAKGRSGNQTE